MDATLTTVGMVTQPEIGVPLAIVTHPKIAAEGLLIAWMSVWIVLAIGFSFIGFHGLGKLAWLFAGACFVFVLLLRRKKHKSVAKTASPRGN